MFDDDIISAVSIDEGMSISTYSFFPSMDSGFMTRQGRDASGHDTEATTVRMACTVSWNHWGPPTS